MAIARSALIAEWTAHEVWGGPLSNGHGTVRSGTGVIDDLPVTWAARIGTPNGKTSPEELATAAHASCFSMALAVRPRVPELDDVAFRVIVNEAAELCPISRLFAGAEITVDASLERKLKS